MIPSDELGDAPVWVVPPEPAWVRALGRTAVVALAWLAMGWWASLAHDAWLGRSSWWGPLVSAAALTAWGVSAWRGLRSSRLASDADDPVWRRLAWRERWSGESSSPWRNAAGEPVDLSVRMDLGAVLLLRLSLRDRGVTVHRWVREADVPGSWRWRLTMSTTSDSGLSEACREIVASSRSSSSSLSSLSPSTKRAPRPSQERA
ncbi:MAG TPA: hypothetical protein VFH49_15750 [Aquabacterium sp.]|nr:hypothetical protein [Aquabacterium sp.]